MPRETSKIHYNDLQELVRCEFRNLTENASKILITRISRWITSKSFDQDGLMSCVDNRNGTNEMNFTRQEANTIRDQLDSIFVEDASSVWFSIFTNPLHGLFSRSLTEDVTSVDPSNASTFRASCFFGSMASHFDFYAHETLKYKVMDVSFEKKFGEICQIRIRLNQDQYIIIPFDSIQRRNILVNHTKPKSTTNVLFPLKHPPLIFEESSNRNQKRQRICNQDGSDMIHNVSLSSDVVFSFSGQDESAWRFLNAMIYDRPKIYKINFGVFEVTEWSKVPNKRQPPDPFDYKQASFKDRYALQILTSLGYVFRDKWALCTDAELKWKQWEQKERYDICCFVAEKLKKDHGYDLKRAKEDYLARPKEKPTNNNNPDQITPYLDSRKRYEMPSCTLTPLRIIFQPMDESSGSRVHRRPEFGGSEHFLLVHIRDEDNDRLHTSSSNVQEYIKQKMLRGIELFGKPYIYFGASNGQMKNFSFWFFNLPSKINSITDAYKILGNFDNITNIATYVSRIGQFFSGTWSVGITLTEFDPKNQQLGTINKPYYKEIPDEIRSERNFTDGIGKISWGLAGLIALKMNFQLCSKEDIPSAFQIRVAGCKGMVAIDPDSSLNDYYIHIRDSMIKFQSDDWNLEIRETARPLPLTFNKQAIRLLEDLGNQYSAFEIYQTEALSTWAYNVAHQPSLIDLALRKRLAYMSGKAALLDVRIPIPQNEGRTMFGVVDETKKLEYGQCFIQYSTIDERTMEKRYHVHTGDVLVTKNPCLWPGDFRVLKAVRNRQLQECMRDVIVFPMKGDRPHPNEMAGSDLDGDQYWVYWGTQLTIKNMVPPLEYQSSKSPKKSNIDQQSIINHIVETFGTSGMIGRIANTHTVAAEKNPQHALSDDCKKLAELFSVAVDAPKTGKTVDESDLKPFLKYHGSYPEFMMKYNYEIYTPRNNALSVTSRLFQRGKDAYFRNLERPDNPTLPMRGRNNKDKTAKEIQDQEFKQWLDEVEGGKVLRKEGAPRKPPARTTEKKPGQRKSIEPKGASKCPDEESDDEQVDRKPETKAKPKTKATPVPERTVLVNSDYSPTTASATSISRSFLPYEGEQSYVPDFIFGVSAKYVPKSSVKITSEVGHDIVTLEKPPTNPDTVEAIVETLVRIFDKYDILKKKPASYNPETFGPLKLIGFYGHIHLNRGTVKAQKVDEFQSLVRTSEENILQFVNADLTLLDIPQNPSSVVKKDAIKYELQCRVKSAPLETISLLFDESKTLRKIGISYVWAKCYVRQPSFAVDTLFEIRSVRYHEGKSEHFLNITKTLFRSANEVNLLAGRKPNITIQNDLLDSSVELIRLKTMEDTHDLSDSAASIKSFYQCVEYLPVREPVTRSNRIPTLEYHVEGITKNKDTLKEIFEDALRPIGKPTISGK